MDRVEDATINITAADLPSFLYKTGTIYNPENEAKGLFRGFLIVWVSLFSFSLRINAVIVQVYRHIFTGPLSAVNP
jgi:hypothetical protein